ncbi:MAG TPA: GntR family transcriptional regulator [Mycobacterium sp.]|nr:GntR family transcriptional regulator [Mycobacterium sp.]
MPLNPLCGSTDVGVLTAEDKFLTLQDSRGEHRRGIRSRSSSREPTPVREALLELSFEGLVQVAPRSGVTVIGISPSDVLDSFTILGVLTGQAAAWAAERIGPKELEMLRELPADVVARSGDDSIGEANWHFHQNIHRAAHSPRLLTQIKQAARVVQLPHLVPRPRETFARRAPTAARRAW